MKEFFKKKTRTNEIKNKTDKIEKLERKDYRKLFKIYDFHPLGMIKSFGHKIINDKITISEPDDDQSNLKENLVECNNNTR